mgnify:CR=1 FL=1|jgi:hypothetical protein
MPFEFNSDQFICNSISFENIDNISFENIDNINNTYTNLKENCKYMKEFDEKRRAELSYIDATNIQQRTWLHIVNLVIACLILLYATKKVI